MRDLHIQLDLILNINSDEEASIFCGEDNDLKRAIFAAISDGRAKLNDNSYITADNIEDFNENYDTHYLTEEIAVDIDRKNVDVTYKGNIFDTLVYDPDEIFAVFIESMDFTIVKVGDGEYSLRDATNWGDIHSDIFEHDGAMGMADRLDIYINDYYIDDTVDRIKYLTSEMDSEENICVDISELEELSTIPAITKFINKYAAKSNIIKEFFNDNLRDMMILDLIERRTDEVDLDIAFAYAETAERIDPHENND